MFYAAQLVSRDGPLQVLWVAATLDRQLNRQLVDGTAIPRVVEVYLAPDAPEGIFSAGPVQQLHGAGAASTGRRHKGGRSSAAVGASAAMDAAPMALRLSGQLLLGVCRIYSRKVVYLLQDCEKALLVLKNIRPTEAQLAYGGLDQHQDDTEQWDPQSSIRTSRDAMTGADGEDSEVRRAAGAVATTTTRGRRRGAAAAAATKAGGGGGGIGPDGEPLMLQYDEDEILLEGLVSQELREGASLELLIGGSGTSTTPARHHGGHGFGAGPCGLAGGNSLVASCSQPGGSSGSGGGMEVLATPFTGGGTKGPSSSARQVPWSGGPWSAGVGGGAGAGAGGCGGLFSDPPHHPAAASYGYGPVHFDDEMPDHFEFDLDEHEIEALRVAIYGPTGQPAAVAVTTATTASQGPFITPPSHPGQSRLCPPEEEIRDDEDEEEEGAEGVGKPEEPQQQPAEEEQEEEELAEDGEQKQEQAQAAVAEGGRDGMMLRGASGHKEGGGMQEAAASVADGPVQPCEGGGAGCSGDDAIDDAATAVGAPGGGQQDPETLPGSQQPQVKQPVSAAAEEGDAAWDTAAAADEGEDATEMYDHDGPPTQPRSDAKSPAAAGEAAAGVAAAETEVAEPGSGSRASPPPRTPTPRRAAALRAQAALAGNPRNGSASLDPSGGGGGRASKKKRTSSASPGPGPESRGGGGEAAADPAGAGGAAGAAGSDGGASGRVTVDVDSEGRLRVMLPTNSVRELLQDRTPILDVGRRNAALRGSRPWGTSTATFASTPSGSAASPTGGCRSPWLSAWSRLTGSTLLEPSHRHRHHHHPNYHHSRHPHHSGHHNNRHPHQHQQNRAGGHSSTTLPSLSTPSAAAVAAAVTSWQLLLRERPLDAMTGPACVPAPALAAPLQLIFRSLGCPASAGPRAAGAAPAVATTAGGNHGELPTGQERAAAGDGGGGPDAGGPTASTGSQRGTKRTHGDRGSSPEQEEIAHGEEEEEIQEDGSGRSGCGDVAGTELTAASRGPPRNLLEGGDGDATMCALGPSVRDDGDAAEDRREQELQQLMDGGVREEEEQDEEGQGGDDERTTVLVVEESGTISEVRAFDKDDVEDAAAAAAEDEGEQGLEEGGAGQPVSSAAERRHRATADGFTARTQAVLRTLQAMAACAMRTKQQQRGGGEGGTTRLSGTKRPRLDAQQAQEQQQAPWHINGDGQGPLQLTTAAELLRSVANLADPLHAAAAATVAARRGSTPPSGSVNAAAVNSNGGRGCSRMTAARTFYDLLVLSNRGYISLMTTSKTAIPNLAEEVEEECLVPERILVVARPRLEEAPRTRAGAAAKAALAAAAAVGPLQSFQPSHTPSELV